MGFHWFGGQHKQWILIINWVITHFTTDILIFPIIAIIANAATPKRLPTVFLPSSGSHRVDGIPGSTCGDGWAGEWAGGHAGPRGAGRGPIQTALRIRPAQEAEALQDGADSDEPLHRALQAKEVTLKRKNLEDGKCTNSGEWWLLFGLQNL